jgi:transposase
MGLYNQPGRGRKKTFNSEQSKKIRDWAKQKPRQLKQVVQKVTAEWDLDISTKIIKRDFIAIY